MVHSRLVLVDSERILSYALLDISFGKLDKQMYRSKYKYISVDYSNIEVIGCDIETAQNTYVL